MAPGGDLTKPSTGIPWRASGLACSPDVYRERGGGATTAQSTARGRSWTRKDHRGRAYSAPASPHGPRWAGAHLTTGTLDSPMVCGNVEALQPALQHIRRRSVHCGGGDPAWSKPVSRESVSDYECRFFGRRPSARRSSGRGGLGFIGRRRGPSPALERGRSKRGIYSYRNACI